MSVSTAKRSLDLVSSGSLAEFDDSAPGHDEIENEHRHDGTHDIDDNEEPKRKGTKIGKKQDLDPETKQKRTAQNRAAQRAFRERKERKMKELEKKVESLQSIQQQNEVEAIFLRDQLVTLVNELKKYRPETRNDSKVLEYLARRDPNLHPSNSDTNNNKNKPTITPSEEIQENVKQKMNFTFHYPLDNDVNNTEKQLPSPNDPVHSAPVSIAQTQKKPGDATDSSTATLDSLSNSNDVLNITPNSSSSMDWLDNVIYTNRFATANDRNKREVKDVDSSMFSNDFNFENQFDEQVSEFCSKMNQVCGTRQCPIPKKPTSSLDKEVFASSSILSGNSPALTNTWESYSNVIPNTPANVTTNEDSLSGFGQLGFDLDVNHYAGNDNNNENENKNSNSNNNNGNSNNKNNADVLPFISESPFDMNQVTNFFSPGSINTTNNATSNNDSSHLQNIEDDVPFINASLAFPDENPTNIQLQNFSQSQSHSQNRFDYDMFFRDSSKEGNNLFDEFLDDDEDDDDNNVKAANASDDESSLIKNQLINEEPQPLNQCMLSALREKSRNSLEKDGGNIQGDKDKDSDNDNSNDNDNDVVPSKEGSLLRCSEIWDRITTHPKYSDIDVDGLCSELMTKAKCSERGVVINAEDVQLALNKHMN
ncbi:yap1p [Saccharomyces arboricola H-6]|uniref:Yap1p n=1 Tax=Saccharomyces arboricola (strain H-6 / AS 2.3317 / CBS 10644) TaxID=1160507 RepID=J8Q190_SACAR|nr:yap1p [Saccharomyces arboricola H-6]